jgi:mannose-6-phosphate isomerase
MHLLEAVLAWEDLGEPGWDAVADEIVALALSKFIDPKGGFLREFFEADWRPAVGDDGRWVEPGHQFEWAWLLNSWAGRRKDAQAAQAAQALYANGLKGVDRARLVAANVLWDDLTVRDASARLWPQTEYLKASLLMRREDEARLAAQALFTYLGTPAPGAWRDLMGPDGRFTDGPAPASSFYHIAGACFALLSA